MDPRPLGDGSFAASVAKLAERELFWVAKQPFLLAQGYSLRPRYQPGWVPSWGSDDRQAQRAEDAICLPFRASQIDATRIEDGKLVYIKRVPTHGEELRIALLFCQEGWRDDEHNHAVPILEVLPDPDDASQSYMVMPFLYPMDRPRFDYVVEVVDYIDQILEGLAYMHEKGVAHRDCTFSNILMDGSGMFPEGSHTVYTSFSADMQHRAKHVSRRDASQPVKYYYIDFGIAVHIPPGSPRLAIGRDGIDRDVPELSMTIPYDPFKVDIFIIGNIFRRRFYGRFANVGFMRPLIESMMRRDPESRPEAAAILEEWRRAKGKIFLIHRDWRLQDRSESFVDTITLDIVYFLRYGMRLSGRFLKRAAKLLVALRKALTPTSSSLPHTP